MKTMNKAALLLLACVLSTSIFAQHKHEFSVWGAGGLSTLKYKTQTGKHKNGFGGALGLGYTYFFSENWGVGTGAEFSMYNASTNLAGLKDSYDIFDIFENQDANLRVEMNKYKEKQRMLSVNIPLFLQFQTSGTHKFYATIGGKLGIPVDETFKVSDSEYRVSAYYPSTNQTLFDPMYPAGYGLHSGQKIKGDLDFKLAFIASAEAGMKWAIGSKYALYTGAYFDYGINNIYKTPATADQRVVEYVSEYPVELKHNSMFNSTHLEGKQLKSFVSKVRPMAVGLKVKFAFGAGGFTPKKQIEEVVYVAPKEEPVVVPVVPQRDLEAEKRAEEARLKREADERKRLEDERIAKEAANAINNVNFVLNDFKINEADITSHHKTLMNESVQTLKKYPEFKVDLVGYTCDLGTPKYNLWLSKRRAEQVKQYLVSQGIDADRITVEGVGRENPDKPNTSGVNRLHNRRVEATGRK